RRGNAARAARRRLRPRRGGARSDPVGVRRRPRGARLAPRDGIDSDAMSRILFRYVLKEMAVPFFAGTCVLCFVALMPQVVWMAEKVLALGIGFGQLGQLIVYLLPPILLFVVPASSLLGVLVAFGRLSADSEMIAMRA